MKHFRIYIVAIAIVAILFGTIATPSYAYPWSDKANLQITVAPTGILGVNVIDCSSATLYGNGRSYSASVSNPFLSNKCVFKVSNAFVGKGVNYTLTFKYYMNAVGIFRPQFTKSVNVYVKRPVLATYSTTVSYKP